ncbi:hypothetical protein CVT26_004864 [Gymnopilus dilepis]|uniref:Translation elongation factor EFTs/EF1B dimerisation domain-containing protein n=1 Tax=Gymnopilus dilepis TaxID=231916 RepID=A0A409WZ61_9AGAR|nr:hypothetical protein CVT26_004864 [Gymnopilus dilepis]
MCELPFPDHASLSSPVTAKMLRQVLRPSPLPLRSLSYTSYRTYSSPPETKVPIALIASLRKQTHVSVSKAREALAHSGLSLPAALEWLQKDLETTGLAKAAKVASRETKHGLIAHAVLGSGGGLKEVGGVRAGVVELGCETDFVAQNRMFAELAVDVAHTAAFMSESEAEASTSSTTSPDGIPAFTKVTPTDILALPIIQHPSSTAQTFPPGTPISSAIHTTIVKVGENISLKRARTIVEPDAPLSPPSNAQTILRLSSYLHGAKHSLPAAPLGALALLRLRSPNLGALIREETFRADLAQLERALAQQIAGMHTLSVRPKPGQESPDEALYNQQLFTFPAIQGLTVQEALKSWSVQKGLIGSEQEEGGLEVLDFLRWAVDGSEEAE